MCKLFFAVKSGFLAPIFTIGLCACAPTLLLTENGLLQPDDLLLDGVLYQLGFVVNIQLSHKIKLMSFYGLYAEVESTGDFLDRIAFRQNLEDFLFACR